ncbi:MAG TPA: DUF4177 domain-containing protein [Gaiellales bacterium]|nr:DUF4177 domain-containing protein [Gaiellales bacterium]
MPLFNKQTEAEKEAERQRKAHENARQDALKAAAHQAEEERKAAERAAYARYVAAVPKFEYKVLSLSSTIWAGAGKFDGGGLQKTLNQHAAEGWRVIEIAMSGKIEKAFSADRNDMYVVFERPAPGQVEVAAS